MEYNTQFRKIHGLPPNLQFFMGMKMIIQEQSVILVRTGGIWKFWHTVFWVDPLGLKTWIFTGYVLLCWVQSHLDLLDAKTWIFWLFLTDVHLFLTRTFPTMVVLRIMLGIQTYTNRYCMHEVTDFAFFFQLVVFSFNHIICQTRGTTKRLSAGSMTCLVLALNQRSSASG